MPTKVLWWLAKDTNSLAGTEDHLRCCGGYRGWLRSIKVAFVAT